MDTPWAPWDESWRERAKPPGQGGRILHYLWCLSKEDTLSYVNHIARGLYEWRHHIVVGAGGGVGGGEQARLLRAGVRIYGCRDSCGVAHVASLQPDVVVIHSGAGSSVAPSTFSAPGPHYIAVYHEVTPGWAAGMHRHVYANHATPRIVRAEIKQKVRVIPSCINAVDYPKDKLVQDDPGRAAPFVVGSYGTQGVAGCG